MTIGAPKVTSQTRPLRDRIAVMDGYDCFRFTGSEINNDPWGCAEQITDWAAKVRGYALMERKTNR
jgi:hypothetical protein